MSGCIDEEMFAVVAIIINNRRRWQIV